MTQVNLARMTELDQDSDDGGIIFHSDLIVVLFLEASREDGFEVWALSRKKDLDATNFHVVVSDETIIMKGLIVHEVDYTIFPSHVFPAQTLDLEAVSLDENMILDLGSPLLLLSTGLVFLS